MLLLYMSIVSILANNQQMLTNAYRYDDLLSNVDNTNYFVKLHYGVSENQEELSWRRSQQEGQMKKKGKKKEKLVGFAGNHIDKLLLLRGTGDPVAELKDLSKENDEFLSKKKLEDKKSALQKFSNLSSMDNDKNNELKKPEQYDEILNVINNYKKEKHTRGKRKGIKLTESREPHESPKESAKTNIRPDSSESGPERSIYLTAMRNSQNDQSKFLRNEKNSYELDRKINDVKSKVQDKKRDTQSTDYFKSPSVKNKKQRSQVAHEAPQFEEYMKINKRNKISTADDKYLEESEFLSTKKINDEKFKVQDKKSDTQSTDYFESSSVESKKKRSQVAHEAPQFKEYMKTNKRFKISKALYLEESEFSSTEVQDTEMKPEVTKSMSRNIEPKNIYPKTEYETDRVTEKQRQSTRNVTMTANILIAVLNENQAATLSYIKDISVESTKQPVHDWKLSEVEVEKGYNSAPESSEVFGLDRSKNNKVRKKKNESVLHNPTRQKNIAKISDVDTEYETEESEDSGGNDLQSFRDGNTASLPPIYNSYEKKSYSKKIEPVLSEENRPLNNKPEEMKWVAEEYSILDNHDSDKASSPNLFPKSIYLSKNTKFQIEDDININSKERVYPNKVTPYSRLENRDSDRELSAYSLSKSKTTKKYSSKYQIEDNLNINSKERFHPKKVQPYPLDRFKQNRTLEKTHVPKNNVYKGIKINNSEDMQQKPKKNKQNENRISEKTHLQNQNIYKGNKINKSVGMQQKQQKNKQNEDQTLEKTYFQKNYLNKGTKINKSEYMPQKQQNFKDETLDKSTKLKKSKQTKNNENQEKVNEVHSESLPLTLKHNEGEEKEKINPLRKQPHEYINQQSEYMPQKQQNFKQDETLDKGTKLKKSKQTKNNENQEKDEVHHESLPLTLTQNEAEDKEKINHLRIQPHESINQQSEYMPQKQQNFKQDETLDKGTKLKKSKQTKYNENQEKDEFHPESLPLTLTQNEAKDKEKPNHLRIQPHESINQQSEYMPQKEQNFKQDEILDKGTKLKKSKETKNNENQDKDEVYPESLSLTLTQNEAEDKEKINHLRIQPHEYINQQSEYMPQKQQNFKQDEILDKGTKLKKSKQTKNNENQEKDEVHPESLPLTLTQNEAKDKEKRNHLRIRPHEATVDYDALIKKMVSSKLLHKITNLLTLKLTERFEEKLKDPKQFQETIKKLHEIHNMAQVHERLKYNETSNKTERLRRRLEELRELQTKVQQKQDMREQAMRRYKGNTVEKIDILV